MSVEAGRVKGAGSEGRACRGGGVGVGGGRGRVGRANSSVCRHPDLVPGF